MYLTLGSFGIHNYGFIIEFQTFAKNLREHVFIFATGTEIQDTLKYLEIKKINSWRCLPSQFLKNTICTYLFSLFFFYFRMYKEAVSWSFTALLLSSSIISTMSFPNSPSYPAPESGFYPSRGVADVVQQLPQQQLQQQERVGARKFAEKPNAIKKVALDDLDDIQTNQISESSGGGGFSWSNLLGTLTL